MVEQPSETPQAVPAAQAVVPVVPPVVPPKKPRRSLLRLFAMVAAVFVLFMIVLVCATPYIVSGDFVRTTIEAKLSSRLRTKVAVESHDFSWFDGLEIVGITIANPAGFPQQQPALVLGRLSGDASILSLLAGEFRLNGVVEGLAVRLYEKADGSTNFGTMLQAPAEPQDPGRAPVGSEPGGRGEPGRRDEDSLAALARIDVDLRVVDSLIEIEHQQRGVLESLRQVEAVIRKLPGSSAVQLSFGADLFRDQQSNGRLDFRADVDADPARPATMRFATEGLDLARYRSLINSFVDPRDYPEAFAGVLGGQVDGEYRPGESLTMSGDLTLVAPRFKGRLFGGLDLGGDKWTFRPKLTVAIDADFNVASISTEGFDVELGFARIQGLASADAAKFARGRAATGFEFDLDLRQLADMGLTALDGLRSGRGRLTGVATVATDLDQKIDPAALAARWAEFVRAEVAVTIDGFQQDGFDLRGFAGDTVVEDGMLTFKSRSGGTLNGGPLMVSVESEVADLTAAKAAVTLQWQRGRIGGDAVSWLRYAVPLLDGLPVENATGLDFHSLVNVAMRLDGPVLPQANETVLEWFDDWRGTGDLALLDGGFTPAAVWKSVLDFADLKTPLDFSVIDSKFSFTNGSVATELMKFNTSANSWSMNGKVDMNGQLDYSIDLKQLLEGRRDGERVLKYLGAKPIVAKLAGSLDRPTLAAPSYADILQQAVAAVAKGALDGLLGGKLDKKLGKKLDKKLGKKLQKGLLDLFKRKKKRE